MLVGASLRYSLTPWETMFLEPRIAESQSRENSLRALRKKGYGKFKAEGKYAASCPPSSRRLLNDSLEEILLFFSI